MKASGIDKRYIKETVRPQDDLYAYQNGIYVDTFQIPPDRSADGVTRELRDRAEAQVREIVEEAARLAGAAPLPVTPQQGAAHEQQLIGALYASFMDTERVEALGLTPLAADLDPVWRAVSIEKFFGVIGELERTGIPGPFGAYVDNDPGDPSRYVLILVQGGIGLPDEAYYREDQHARIREAYRAHLERMFTLLAQSGVARAMDVAPASAAERIYALEERLAAAHWDVVASRDADATYNPMTWEQLVESAPAFPWEELSRGLARRKALWRDLVVAQPSFFEALGVVARDVELEDWKLWATWRVLVARAGLLNDEVVRANFDFYSRTLSGAQELRERWKRGVSFVESAAGEAVGRIYTQRHFPPENKAKIKEIVDRLIAAYRESIKHLDWLGPETKQKALDKLAKFTPKVGYPDKWRSYAALRANPQDLVGNARAASIFETKRELAKLGGPVDRDEWLMTPQTVNAYYNPGMNEIVFPAAILQPPMFDAQADDAVNYGGIGAIIGHEIGHGFDDQGSKYDGDGRLINWWTPHDRAAFEARTRALIEQYDAFTVHLADGDRPVNGALTIGENIGDLGGLTIALKAYRASLQGAQPPVIDDMTGDQRFFRGWAQAWRDKTRDELAALRLAVDPHSPDHFRCNGPVSNIDAFYDAFDVQPGDGLYLPPEERVRIW